MIVEVPTYYDGSITILTEDVTNDLYDSQCSILVVEALTTLKVAVEYLYLDVACGQSSPTQVGPQCLDELVSDILSISSSSPATPFTLKHSLV